MDNPITDALLELPRTRSQRWSDATAHFCGSWGFVLWTFAIMVSWVGLNTVWLVFGQFDAYPFILFNLFLTIVSTLQGPMEKQKLRLNSSGLPPSPLPGWRMRSSG